MEGAWSAALVAVAAELASEQVQDGGDSDQSFHGVEVDGRVIGDCGGLGAWLLRGLVLSQVFASFAGLGEFAVAFGEDFLVLAVEFVLGG